MLRFIAKCPALCFSLTVSGPFDLNLNTVSLGKGSACIFIFFFFAIRAAFFFTGAITEFGNWEHNSALGKNNIRCKK
ncbi:MAG: hypothetical protein HYT34_01960 [Candidatus Ryanbacteria bacterium]|nr:hypothetical protein [Candidatus Ryanbacteria bacterium]